MRMNFKVSFYLRSNYENKEGKSPVMLRVFLNGEMANFGSTKIFVDKTLWNNTGSRLRGRTNEALSVNVALDSISTTLNSIFQFENDETLSLDKIRSYFVGKDREYTTFLPVFDKFNDDIRQRVGHTISQDSLQKYSVLRRHFGEFLSYKYACKDINLTELTPAVVQDFELYLSTGFFLLIKPTRISSQYESTLVFCNLIVFKRNDKLFNSFSLHRILITK